MADTSIASDYVIGISSGLLSAFVAIGSSFWIWQLGRKAQRRDDFATIAGQWIACSFDCLEKRHREVSLRESWERYRKGTPTSEDGKARHLDGIRHAESERLNADIALESSLARLRISRPSHSVLLRAQQLTQCLRHFPHDPERMNGWLEREFDQYRATIKGPYKITDLGAEGFSTYRLQGMRMILSDFSYTLAHAVDCEDPVHTSPE